MHKPPQMHKQTTEANSKLLLLRPCDLEHNHLLRALMVFLMVSSEVGQHWTYSHVSSCGNPFWVQGPHASVDVAHTLSPTL